ncbi:MAG: glycoside hydrolase family 3 N-terminal domain-containing protein [Oscillospiraceae bacterium]|jgi:beta-N-acetylhexosaminidase|nr:glycoside hydrolase family 3 N-terminal domain-containing protein [Oscillospiraceae bacterium]
MSHDVNRICKALCVLFVLALIGGAACRIRSTDPDAEGSGASNDVAASTTNETRPSETPTTPGKSTESSVTETSAAETLPPVDESREFAENLLGEMSLEQKVGQMFFASWVSGDVAEAIGLWHFGGIVLFAPDFEYSDPAAISDTIRSYQSMSATPMLIGVDEEGGTVVRISKFTQFRAEKYRSPQALFEQGGMEAIRADTAGKARFLLDMGINVNLAPVCDVSTDEGDFIFERSFGRTAGETADYVTAVVEEMARVGLGCALKHFPGYGNNVDTHTGIAMDHRDYEDFVASDFLPFEAGVTAGAGSVMVSHNIVYCMDELLPASLSPNVHRILREELGFSGVIMTDDLSMDAIKDHTGDREAAVLAVLAGNDMIIGSAYAEQIPAVIAAVRSGEIDESVIDEAVIRILLWKISLDLIE